MIKVYEKKIKNKKQIILEVNENKIILENPSIQPYNEFVYNGPESIMYFYYDMSIYEDINFHISSMSQKEREEWLDGDENTKKIWRKKTDVRVFEFGVIPSLPEFIDEIIKFDIKNEGAKTYFWERDPVTRKHIRSTTDYECSYTFELKGMCEEDNFYITKYCRYFDSSWNDEKEEYEPKYVEYYKVFIGCGNNQVKGNVTGIMFTIWNVEDLLKIKEWANLFLEYSGEVALSNINEMYKKEEDDYYYPYFFKKHLEEKYPEDVSKLKELYPKLYRETSVLEEYYNYCKGNPIEEPITLQRETEITAQKLMDEGMKDYEAYIELARRFWERI